MLGFFLLLIMLLSFTLQFQKKRPSAALGPSSSSSANSSDAFPPTTPGPDSISGQGNLAGLNPDDPTFKEVSLHTHCWARSFLQGRLHIIV